MSALLLVRVVRALLHQTDAQQREIAKLKSQVSALHTLLGQSRQTAVNAEARAEETADQASKHASSLRRAQNQLSEWERHFGGLVEFKSEAQRRIQLASRDLLNHPLSPRIILASSIALPTSRGAESTAWCSSWTSPDRSTLSE